MKFEIDQQFLSHLQEPAVQLNESAPSEAVTNLTAMCGCGGRCLSTTT